MSHELTGDRAWAPDACTLPTADQPLRIAEFGELFAGSVQRVTQLDDTRIEVEFRPDPAVAAQAAELLMRETACCSFFTFTLTMSAAALRLGVEVPPSHGAVLRSLAQHADTTTGGILT